MPANISKCTKHEWQGLPAIVGSQREASRTSILSFGDALIGQSADTRNLPLQIKSVTILKGYLSYE